MHGRDEGARRLVRGTRANCEAMDAADRSDEQLTRRWGDRVADAMQQGDGETFEDFIAQHPELARGNLLGLPAWKIQEPGDELRRAIADISHLETDDWSGWSG